MSFLSTKLSLIILQMDSLSLELLEGSVPHFALDIIPHYSSSPLLKFTLPEGGADLTSSVCLLLYLVQKTLSRCWS